MSAAKRAQVSTHVLREAVVLDDLRLCYVPVPKAGSTAILWALAGLAGLGADAFARSRKLEVSRSLAVHDASVWGHAHRLDGRNATELELILRSDDWFRFSVVRDPVSRLWSAWVSKILMRDPRFTATFGGEDWYPSVPERSEDIVGSFRRFVAILPFRASDWHDQHWSSQADLIGMDDIVYGHIGRVESLDATVTALRSHLGKRGEALPELRVENRSLLPFTPAVLDSPSLETCIRWTARDCEALGYEPLTPDASRSDAAWRATAEAIIPALQVVIERNERIGDLYRVLNDSRSSGRPRWSRRR